MPRRGRLGSERGEAAGSRPGASLPGGAAASIAAPCPQPAPRLLFAGAGPGGRRPPQMGLPAAGGGKGGRPRGLPAAGSTQGGCKHSPGAEVAALAGRPPRGGGLGGGVMVVGGRLVVVWDGGDGVAVTPSGLARPPCCLLGGRRALLLPGGAACPPVGSHMLARSSQRGALRMWGREAWEQRSRKAASPGAWGKAGLWTGLSALQEGPVALCITPGPPAHFHRPSRGFDARMGQVGGNNSLFCPVSVSCFVTAAAVLGWVAVLSLYEHGINAGLVVGFCVSSNGLDKAGRGNI